jgi:ADP-ribosyl-[dinitrogen reductase] hydrolase
MTGLDPFEDRAIGALIGLAIGDALGAAVEFQPPDSFTPVTGYRAGGPHGLAAGEWTDDTSMALALADSIVEVGWDLDDQAQRYVHWWRSGEYSVNGRCFDIGITTSRSLTRFAAGEGAATSGDPSERAAGNGSIMRLAPVPTWLAHSYPKDAGVIVQRSVESSLPTHRAPQALAACGYFGLVLAALISGEDRVEVLRPDWHGIQTVRSNADIHPAVDEVIAGSYQHRGPPEIVGSGYVVRSLEAALWAFAGADGFASAVLAAVNLGDDADTTGAVCGQLAGAYWGLSGIPMELLDGLVKRDIIETAARRLINAST